MKRRCLVLAGFLALASVAAGQEAPDTQAGNFLFKLPNGWTPVEKGDTTILNAPAPPPGTVTFIALAADDLQGDLRQSFDLVWTGFARSYRVLEGGRPVPLHSPNGYDAISASAAALDQQGRRWSVVVLGAQYKKRLETVMFMSSVPPGPMLAAYGKVFDAFVANLRFGEALPGAPAPPPAAGAAALETPHVLPPGALEGIYVGFELGASGQPSMKRLHFNPDGWVVKDVPPEGMIGFDFTAYRNDRNTNRSWVGRYRVDGERITIEWQDYPGNRTVIKRNESSAAPGWGVYVPMCRCTGKRFAGTYRWGAAAADQYLQVFPDGSFIDHRVLDQLIVPSPYYEHPRIQRGSYAIESQSMIFTFADGRRGMRTFYAPKAQEAAPMFDFIGLGWQALYEAHVAGKP